MANAARHRFSSLSVAGLRESAGVKCTRGSTPPWKKRHGNCALPAQFQNAFIETQKPPINLAETLRIGKPSQKCASFWSAAVFCRFGMMRGVVRIVPRICTVNLNLVS
ncbi:MAG: hypothetical protein DMF14_02150 [Verrucomicrobia bacterium]|nr:MAG: hypothetical protein DMF14_02150 [Verrucomicrobiota bacterium]